MAIPEAETRAIKEEIEKTLFREAFIKLAVEFRRRDRKGFEIAGLSVRRVVENLPVKNIFPPAGVEAKSIDLELLHQSGLRDALSSYDRAIQKIRNAFR